MFVLIRQHRAILVLILAWHFRSCQEVYYSDFLPLAITFINICSCALFGWMHIHIIGNTTKSSILYCVMQTHKTCYWRYSKTYKTCFLIFRADFCRCPVWKLVPAPHLQRSTWTNLFPAIISKSIPDPTRPVNIRPDPTHNEIQAQSCCWGVKAKTLGRRILPVHTTARGNKWSK